jgi:hypothetical protein
MLFRPMLVAAVAFVAINLLIGLGLIILFGIEIR